jgi:hypothetical protein
MGNVSDKLSELGESITNTATDVTKRVKCMLTVPKQPIAMLNLGDGRSADEMRTTAEMMYNMDTKQCVNIGFLGPSNELKTSLINSCRYLADSLPDLGVVNPNKNATQFVHMDPAYKHVRFWDIYDKEGSFVDRCLYAYDALILVIPESIRASDVPLIREAAKLQPPWGVLIARSGMDRFFDTHFGLDPIAKDAINGKTQQGSVIKENLKSQLGQAGLDANAIGEHFYLVSAPGMLAARGVNFDGIKYLWDEFDFLVAMLDCVAKRRY